MSNYIQQANQVLNAQDRGFVEGVISTTELYFSNINLKRDDTTVKSEVIKNLQSLDMSQENIEYWVEEFFGEELI
jgi:hypothetical protein